MDLTKKLKSGKRKTIIINQYSPGWGGKRKEKR